MVGVKVGTYLWVDTRWSLANLTGFKVVPTHAIHVGRRSAEVGYISLEAIHLDDLSRLAQYALFGAAGHKLALVSRYGTKRAAPETASVHIDGVFDHLVGWDGFALVLGVRHACVG